MTLPQRCQLVVVGYGATACHWSIHALLQRCPLPADFQLCDSPDAEAVGLHLQPVDLSLQLGDLERLRGLPLVLDPSPERVQRLRDLGLNAVWLDPQAPRNGWLDVHYDPAAAARLFGLPDPALLPRHGARLCLGSAGEEWERQLQPPNWGLPGFAELHVPDEDAARLLAGWLNACQRCGLQLVRLQPSDYERHCLAYSALEHPEGDGVDAWLPALLLEGALDNAALEEELAWLRSGRLTSPDCPTPSPEHEVLWEGGFRQQQNAAAGPISEGQAEPMVAVCVSLYNYRERILTALESVHRQSHASLELIIVDDASSDGGDQQVCQWLHQHGQRFARAALLRHRVNGGLAAARNSAFAYAQSAWCFVLDADNALKPEAVACCLSIAMGCPEQTAVIHPLVELRSEANLPGQPQQTLLTRLSWQQHGLKDGNKIDAMAMIRRSHWQMVGGFSHIPDGWEDYDFWCKLIDAGLHGVICPQVLAIYNRHASSMQASSTLPSLRALNRLLTARHPWLQLDHRM